MISTSERSQPDTCGQRQDKTSVVLKECVVKGGASASRQRIPSIRDEDSNICSVYSTYLAESRKAAAGSHKSTRSLMNDKHVSSYAISNSYNVVLGVVVVRGRNWC